MKASLSKDKEIEHTSPHRPPSIYLTVGRHIKSPLNGNDLKQLGYKQGRQYKQILDELLTARLDGKIGDSPGEAVQFLREKYPLT